MSKITFQCYSCSQTLRVDEQKAGRKAKCPGCGTALTIPVATMEAAQPAPERLAARVASAATSETQGHDATAVSTVDELPMVTDAVEEPPEAPLDEAAEEAQPRKAGGKKKKKGAKNWLMTRIGLVVIFISLCLVVLTLMLSHIAALIDLVNTLQGPRMDIGSGSGGAEARATILKISGILFLLVLLPWFLGQALTLLGPRNGLSIGTTAAGIAFGGLGWLVFLLLRLLIYFNNPIITVQSQFPNALWYGIVPALFVGAIGIAGALQTYGVASLTRSRWARAALGCAGALGLCMMLHLGWSFLLGVIKVDFGSTGTLKALQWGHWIIYWVCALLELGALGFTAFIAFMARISARN